MHAVGKLTIYLGILMVASGLAVGFTGMAIKSDFAAQWIGLVPLGFLMLLLGTVMTQLSRPRK
jgi:hypothetical protein